MTKATHCQQIRRHLWAGHALTADTARQLYGCTRLAGRIFDLKLALRAEGAGYRITCKMISVGTRDGGTARVAEYRLENSVGPVIHPSHIS